MIMKFTLREEVKKILVIDMLDGKVQPGDRLSLADIASKLSVSVTPVREALNQLTGSRVIDNVPKQGFVVPELNEKEAIEIYKVIGALESFALESANYTDVDILEIEKSQSKFLKAANNLERVKYDMAFHRSLIAPCNNELLKKLIEDVRIRVFFYELKFMNSNDLKATSESQHDLIIDLLKNEKNSLAAQSLRNNWTQGIDQVLTQIEAI